MWREPHTHTGQTPFLVVKERKPRSLSTVLVLTSVVSQCVTEEGKKKSRLSERARPAWCSMKHTCRRGWTLRGLGEHTTHWHSRRNTHSHAFVLNQLSSGRRGNKTWGWGSAIFRLKWKIYKRRGSSAWFTGFTNGSGGFVDSMRQQSDLDIDRLFERLVNDLYLGCKLGFLLLWIWDFVLNSHVKR